MSVIDTHAPLKPVAQHQKNQPGSEAKMVPEPHSTMELYKPAGKLAGKTALITGGDSGIGRAVAIGYAKEGANVSIVYLDDNEDKDAALTKVLVEQTGRECLIIKGDISCREFCQSIIDQVVEEFGELNILVNNAAQQYPEKNFEDITPEQLEHTFRTNIFPLFYLTQAAVKHMKEGDCIINTASITAFQGHKTLIDYASTKGAIVAFTRSLALNLADKKIRVNMVAPGPIWTPLIPSSFDAAQVGKFGLDTTMQRPGQPDEVAPAYIYLASDDASYVTGQTIHVNGGTIING